MLLLRCFKNTDPKATVWATQFYFMLKEQWWKHNGADGKSNSGRIPHAEDVFDPSFHVFGNQDLAGTIGRNN